MIIQREVPRSGNQTVVGGLACLLTAIGLACVSITKGTPLEGVLPPSVALIAIAALYLLAEVVTLNFEVGRHGVAVTIGDLPLILGAFLLPPELLLAASLVGAVSVRSARHTPALKSLFNLGVDIAEIGLACWMLSVFTGGSTTLKADDWWIPFAIVALVNIVSLAAVLVAIRFLEGPPTDDDIAGMTVTVLVSGVFSATLAIICLLVLHEGGYGLILLLVVAAVLALIYRSYSAMLRRHADLDQLMTATRVLSESHTEGHLAEALVNETRRIVGAGSAVLLRGEQPELHALMRSDDAILIPERTRVAEYRDWLVRHDHRDALLVKVGDDAALGTLVITDRVGNSSSFTSDDLGRLHMLVRHAEALWANGLLAQRLQYDATHDSLTGLSNRQHLLFTMTHRLQSTVVSSGPVDPERCDAALLLLDLDHFKEINDSLGHPLGDSLLVVVAERLRTLAPESSHVARLGGDEFGILLPPSSINEVMRIADRVREGLREPVVLGETRVEVGCAVGLSLVPQDGTDAATVLRRADVAMYASKRTSRITRHHAALDTASVDRLEIVGDLRRSLDDGGVRPWFQPKVDLETGQVVGFEALARWEHPTRGMVFPDEFVPLAEQGGLAGPLTSTMLARSLVECRRWSGWAAGIGIAVNVPARQLEDNEFALMVARVLDETGVSPTQLTLEITEGAAVPRHLEALRSLSDLREVGVRIAVDDFGTGYSALGYLHRLPVDEVKIDKSFVMPMRSQPEAAAIVRTIIELSSRLGITTVAEGVEELDVVQQLRGLGCGIAQGFLVSRPLPAHRVMGWLDEYNPATVLPQASRR